MANAAYPLRWRVMDALEATLAAVWPRGLDRAVPWLLSLIHI